MYTFMSPRLTKYVDFEKIRKRLKISQKVLLVVELIIVFGMKSFEVVMAIEFFAGGLISIGSISL